MSRSSNAIKNDAEACGKQVHEGTISDNDSIQVLCALVEELAENVERIEFMLQKLK